MANTVHKVQKILKIIYLTNVVMALSSLDLNETRSERRRVERCPKGIISKIPKLIKLHSSAYGFLEIESLWDSARMFRWIFRDMSRTDLLKNPKKSKATRKSLTFDIFQEKTQNYARVFWFIRYESSSIRRIFLELRTKYCNKKFQYIWKI